MNIERTVVITALTIGAGAANAQLIRSGSSADAAGLTAIVEEYRNDLGQLNAPTPGSVGSGRRQIDWDAAPDSVSAPNDFAGDFFNANFAPRARGVEFTTQGSGFQLSATADSGQGERFSNINSSYADQFSTFSPERLFTAIGSNVVDVNFFIPGTNQAATTRGFGAVFTDVDWQGSTFIEYYDVYGDQIGSYTVEAGPTESGSLSFLGVSFEEAIIASVRIYSGSEAVGGLETEFNDLVVMDDFIFGEPVPVPATLAVVPAVALCTRRRRR